MQSQFDPNPSIHATTVLGVFHNGEAVIGADGQATVGNTVMKSGVRKVRELQGGKLLVGFAGSTSDAFTLLEKLEEKLNMYRSSLERAAVELAKEWRTTQHLRRLEAMLAAFDGYVGVNNHMGSRATRDAEVMAAVFANLARRELVFVDSLTHPASIAREAAAASGLAAFDRDVFLDSPGADPRRQLDAALALARETGQAIAIGHPYPATLEALDELQAKADAAGVDLVSVGELRAPAAPRLRAASG